MLLLFMGQKRVALEDTFGAMTSIARTGEPCIRLE